ncbi:DNA gyrase/topoisomerase IV, subunit A family protein, partial [Vibrio parahaemolyticus V-223/04]
IRKQNCLKLCSL